MSFSWKIGVQLQKAPGLWLFSWQIKSASSSLCISTYLLRSSGKFHAYVNEHACLFEQGMADRNVLPNISSVPRLWHSLPWNIGFSCSLNTFQWKVTMALIESTAQNFAWALMLFCCFSYFWTFVICVIDWLTYNIIQYITIYNTIYNW